MINLLPTGFVEQMKKLLPTDFEQFFTVLDTPPPVSIRYNPRKISFENLEHMPIKSQVPWHPYGYYLESRPSFTFDPLFHAGAYYVQEASSMFLHEVLKLP
jgi:16S rRNA C967 or C1407 C5-methylase (RsmB/RsmF family)